MGNLQAVSRLVVVNKKAGSRMGKTRNTDHGIPFSGENFGFLNST